MHALAEGRSVRLFDVNGHVDTALIHAEQSAKDKDVDWKTVYESGNDVQSLELSFSTPTRLLWSKRDSDEDLADSTVYACLWSEWKLTLFDDIKDAVKARNSSSAYYCCASNIARLSRLGWSVPADLNPDMTRVVTDQQADFRQAALTSLPHASVAGEGLVKTFIEYARRNAPLSAKEVLCPPLTLSDRNYLFYSNSIASSSGFTTSPLTPPNSINRSAGINDFTPDAIYYQINCDAIRHGLDARTTCMLRNIPNKYTQTMVIAMLNENHWGAYDFVYLRMDFKNHCNVGYAFVNFATPRGVAEFVEKVAGRRWARFNSEKVCRVTYARIQGRDALIDRFRRSRVMLESAAYRPRLFYTSGPLTGHEEPFPACCRVGLQK